MGGDSTLTMGLLPLPADQGGPDGGLTAQYARLSAVITINTLLNAVGLPPLSAAPALVVSFAGGNPLAAFGPAANHAFRARLQSQRNNENNNKTKQSKV